MRDYVLEERSTSEGLKKASAELSPAVRRRREALVAHLIHDITNIFTLDKGHEAHGRSLVFKDFLEVVDHAHGF